MVAAGFGTVTVTVTSLDHDIHQVGRIHRFGLIPRPDRSGHRIADQNDVLAGDRAGLIRDRIDEERHPFREPSAFGFRDPADKYWR